MPDPEKPVMGSPEFNEAVNKTLETPEAAPAPAPDKKDDEKVLEEGALDPKVLADIRAGHVIPKSRLDEEIGKVGELSKKYDETVKYLTQLTEALKVYESFGSPEDLKVKLSKPSEPAVTLSDEDKANREYLLSKVAPELRNLPEIQKEVAELVKELKDTRAALTAQKEELQKADEAVQIRHNERATSEIMRLGSEQGFPMNNAKVQKMIVEGVAEIINSDPELAKKHYVEKDLSIIAKVCEEVFKDLSSGIQRSTKAEIVKVKKEQSKTAKAPLAGGTPEIEVTDKSKMTWAERNKAAVEMLEQSAG